MHRDECGNSPTLLEDFAHTVAGCFGRDHADVDALGRDDLFEADVESVCKHQRLAWTEVALDVIAVESRLSRIRREDHDDLRLVRGVVHRRYSESNILCGRTTARVFPQANDDIDAAISQVQSVGVSLTAVADDRHSPPSQTLDIRVTVVEKFRHGFLNTRRRPATTVARFLRAPVLPLAR